ncbi:MAG: MFS transporter [Rhodospirillales bacterium]|nr:MFS transporter [Rhodospirillales bacterium]
MDSTRDDWRTHHLLVLVVLSVLHVAVIVGLFTVPALAVSLKQELGLSSETIGYSSSLIFVMCGLTSIVFVGTTAKFGGGKVLQASLVVMSAGGLLVAISEGSILFFAGLGLFGLGYGVMMPVTSVVLAQFTPASRKNFSFSTKQSGTPIGATIAGIACPFLAAAWGWEASFLLIAATCALGALGLLFFAKAWDVTADSKRKIQSPGAGIRIIAADPTLRRLVATGLFFSMSQLASTSFLVLYMVEDLQRAPATAGFYFSLAYASGFAGRFVSGWLADRYNDTIGVLVFNGVLAAVAAGVLAMVSPGVPEAIVVILVVASGVSGFSWNGLYHAAVASNAKPDQLGEVIGGSYGFVFLGSLAGPGISALLYGLSGSYVVVFMYVGLMALFGAISVVPLRNRKASVDEPKNT